MTTATLIERAARLTTAQITDRLNDAKTAGDRVMVEVFTRELARRPKSEPVFALPAKTAALWQTIRAL